MILKFDFKTPGREDSGEVKLASKQEARGKYGLKVQNVGQASPDITASQAPVAEGKELSKKEKHINKRLVWLKLTVDQIILLMLMPVSHVCVLMAKISH